MERLGKEEKRRQEIHTVNRYSREEVVVSETASSLSVCVCVFVCTYWSLEFAVFWHLCSRLQLLSVSEHPPLEQLYLRDRAKLRLLHKSTIFSYRAEK